MRRGGVRDIERDREVRDEYEDSLSESDSLSSAAGSAGASGFGKVLRYSRMPSVRRPIEHAVKKLMAKRVFFGLSLGKRPSRDGCSSGSLRRSANDLIPRAATKSSKRILMKIREDEVVSSSFR